MASPLGSGLSYLALGVSPHQPAHTYLSFVLCLSAPFHMQEDPNKDFVLLVVVMTLVKATAMITTASN
jgi:hypothetical protein